MLTHCCGVAAARGENEHPYWNIYLQIKNNKVSTERERERGKQGCASPAESTAFCDVDRGCCGLISSQSGTLSDVCVMLKL